MSNRTVNQSSKSFSVDEILAAGGVDSFLKQKKINTMRRKLSGSIKIDEAETRELLTQLRQQG